MKYILFLFVFLTFPANAVTTNPDGSVTLTQSEWETNEALAAQRVATITQMAVAYEAMSAELIACQAPTPTPTPTPAPTPVPTTVATLFYDDFESGGFTHTQNGIGWGGRSAGSGDQQPVVSEDIARSGTRSVKFTFGGGAAGDDAWSELRYFLGANMPEVYVQFYVYYPDGTEGLGPKWQHRRDFPDNNKFFKLWADSYSPYTVATGVSTWSNTTLNDVYFTEYGTNQTGGVGSFSKDRDYDGATDARLGKWLKVQIRTKIATAANNDGVIQMWIDDALVLDDTALNLYPSGGTGNHLRNGYFMGWLNSGVTQTSYMYLDDVTFSDRPI